MIARLAGVNPSQVVLHEASLLLPVAFLVAWESGKEVFRSAWGGVAVLIAQVSMFGLAAGYGGSYTALALPATSSRQLLVPAVIALFFRTSPIARGPGWQRSRSRPVRSRSSTRPMRCSYSSRSPGTWPPAPRSARTRAGRGRPRARGGRRPADPRRALAAPDRA